MPQSFNGRTSALQADDRSSILPCGSKICSRYSHMNLLMVANRDKGVRANLGDSYRDERNTVRGAIPWVGTKYGDVSPTVKALDCGPS